MLWTGLGVRFHLGRCERAAEIYLEMQREEGEECPEEVSGGGEGEGDGRVIFWIFLEGGDLGGGAL